MTDIRATNLNHLLLMEALLETGSVTRAARQLGLTQSGASNALAQLRLIFDDPLFVRSGRGIRPTPRALEVGPDVRTAMASVRRALGRADFAPHAMERTFAVAMPDLVQAVVLPAALARIARDAPQVRLRVVSWAPHRVPDAVSTGEIDLFAGFCGAIGPECRSARLYDDVYVALLRSRHPALRRGSLTLDRWLAADHVVVSSEPFGPTDVDLALSDRGLARRVTLRVENALLLPFVVRSTDLIALVDRRLGERIVGEGTVLAIPPLRLRRGRVRLVWRATEVEDRALSWLRAVVHDAVATVGFSSRRRPW